MFSQTVVTKDNFAEIISLLRVSLPTASFISFDEEMTGIMGSNDAERMRRDDTPAARYERMALIASKYRMIQFGLCLKMVSTTAAPKCTTPLPTPSSCSLRTVGQLAMIS